MQIDSEYLWYYRFILCFSYFAIVEESMGVV